MSTRDTVVDALFQVLTDTGVRTIAREIHGADRIHDLLPWYGSDDSKDLFAASMARYFDDGSLLSSSDLHEISTVDDVVNVVSGRMEVRVALYKCTNTTRTHYFTKPGSGPCIFDGTGIVSA